MSQAITYNHNIATIVAQKTMNADIAKKIILFVAIVTCLVAAINL